MSNNKQPTKECIEEFKKAFQEEFGLDLSDDEVREMSMRLLTFFGVLRDPADQVLRG